MGKISAISYVSIFLLTVSLAAQEKKQLAPIQVEQGWLMGMLGSDTSITVYKGVPFAAPPVGELRWRAPQFPLKWEGVRKADKFSANPIQVMHESFGTLDS